MNMGRTGACAQISPECGERAGVRESDVVRSLCQTPAGPQHPGTTCKVEKFSVPRRQTVCSIVLVVVQDTMATGDDGVLAHGTNGTSGSDLTLTDEGGRVTARRQRAPLTM